MKKLSTIILLLIVALLPLASSHGGTKAPTMNGLAEDYVKFCLKLDQYDPGYVDAYLGPEAWKPAKPASEIKPTPEDWALLKLQAQVLLKTLATMDPSAKLSEIEQHRHAFMQKSLTSALARVELLSGRKMDFDEEALALYDAKAPVMSDAELKTMLTELDKAVPAGKGTLGARFNTYRNQFIIPKDKLDAVFKAAIAEARQRTRKFINLPKNENFTVSYVTGKPWSAYNWYKGDYQSLIEVNIDQPLYIDQILGYASHEGYPGHHVQNILRERELYKGRKWVEFSVYPLFHPSGILSEGGANYGVGVAFPETEKMKFEADVLFPLAGLDTTKIAEYHRIMKLRERLNSKATTETARRFLNGTINDKQVEEMLMTYALESPERSQRRLRFIKTYRSYIINYDIGQDMMRDFVEQRSKDNPQQRWQWLTKLYSEPYLPSDL